MSVNSKLITYKISPKRYAGVGEIQKSALTDMVDVLKVILGDNLIDFTIIQNAIKITVPERVMDNILERSAMMVSCEIEYMSTTVQ